jgi:OmpA-OmpF porin, OOP family
MKNINNKNMKKINNKNMKKIFSILCALCASLMSFAQSNYAGSSRFTDNWSISLQGGVLTGFNNFFSGHTAAAPTVTIGLDKYITPWFGLGIEGRTLIGTGRGHADGICYSGVPNAYNAHTAFDAVNVSGYAKFNVLNMFSYNGHRKFFEPVVYTGLGWGHQTCSKSFNRNYMTFRSGAELNFNFGKERAWAVVVNPSVVFGDINNGKLMKSHGHFEVNAGVVYHFKTSNGTHDFAKAKLYDQTEINHLNSVIGYLRVLNRGYEEKIEILKNYVNQHDTIYIEKLEDNSNKFYFEKNSLNLTGDISELAKSLKESGSTCVITGYASKEGSEKRNNVLAERRANVLKQALVKSGVDTSKIKVINGGSTDKFSKTSLKPNRVAVVEK